MRAQDKGFVPILEYAIRVYEEQQAGDVADRLVAHVALALRWQETHPTKVADLEPPGRYDRDEAGKPTPAARLARFRHFPAFANYSAVVDTTAIYPDAGNNILYPVIGLVDEACEVAAVVAGLFDDQVRPGDHRVVAALLAAITDFGIAVGLVKKLHRDQDGVVDAAFIAAFEAALDAVKNDLECLSDAARHELHVEFPPLVVDAAARASILKEAGDCCWYPSRICTEAGTTLQAAALGNGAKLADRMARGVIKGDGDDR